MTQNERRYVSGWCGSTGSKQHAACRWQWYTLLTQELRTCRCDCHEGAE